MITLSSFARAAFGVTAALVIAGCATDRGPAIRSDYDRNVDFASYKTFGFPENTGTDRGGYTTLVTSHFKDAVRREMTLRGYTFVETSPDLLVNFYNELKDRTRVYSRPGWATMGVWGTPYWNPYWRLRYGFYSAWPFYYDRDIDVVEYKTGTIRIDVVDAARKQVIWEAHVEERLTDQAQDNPQPLISRLVSELFRKFPRSSSAQ